MHTPYMVRSACSTLIFPCPAASLKTNLVALRHHMMNTLEPSVEDSLDDDQPCTFYNGNAIHSGILLH